MKFHALVLASSLLSLSACQPPPLRWTEVEDALAQARTVARVDAFTTGIVEISTDFTLGQAADAAAAELHAFLESQVPCSTVTRAGASVTMDFGTLDDPCVYNGRTYAGVTTVTLARVDEAGAEVVHRWEGMTDGEVRMDGEAVVTWEAGTEGPGTGTRTVVHAIDWTVDGTTWTGTGDRTQALLVPADGIAGGIVIDGRREWAGPEGTWVMGIDGVEARPQDPVPQVGTYTLFNPEGKTATLDFTRLDDDTIEVVLAGAIDDHVWHVTATGAEYQGDR